MTGEEFKRILLPCYRKMYTVAFAILRNEDDASDAVQDSIARLWQRHRDLAIPANPASFCLAAVRNVCIDKLRNSSHKYLDSAERMLDVSSSDSTDTSTSYDSTKRFIRKVLEGFPDKQRQVLTLNFINQLTYDEISGITGESVSNVRQIVSRGRLKLREILND